MNKRRGYRNACAAEHAVCTLTCLLLIDGLGHFTVVLTCGLLPGRLFEVGLQYHITCGSRYTPFAVTSCAFKIHRASGPVRTKPVLISILAFFARVCVSHYNSRTQQFQIKSYILCNLYPTLNTWYCLWSNSWLVK